MKPARTSCASHAPTVVPQTRTTSPRHQTGSGTKLPVFAGLSNEPGERLGPYQLVCKLGSGSFGTVWRAERQGGLSRRVAIKILHPEQRGSTERFRREAQTLAIMDHPNIVKVFDLGMSPDGRPYFIMEHIDGLSLEDHCRRYRPSVSERLELFAQICDGVQHAHSSAIVHRDIKPSNILVTWIEGRAVAKVFDFGVAKSLHGADNAGRLTEGGDPQGTWEYMSPEQAEARANIDARSDVYGLGAVLYELLTGALPFESQMLRRLTRSDRVALILRMEPARPSARVRIGDFKPELAPAVDPALLARQLERELEWIPLKALRKEADERYATAKELADDVRNYLNGEALRAGPERTGYRFRKAMQRHRTLAAGVGAVALALCGGVITTAWQWHAANIERGKIARLNSLLTRANEEARSKRDEAQRQRDNAHAALDWVRTVIDDADPRVIGTREGGTASVTLRDALDRAVTRLKDGELNDRPLVRGQVLESLATAALNQHRAPLALPLAREAVELLEGGGTDRIRAQAHLAAARALAESGSFAASRIAAGKCLQIAAHDPELDAAAHSVLCAADLALGGVAAIDEARAQIQEMFESSGHVETAGTMFRRSNLAMAFLARGRRTDAIEQSDLSFEAACSLPGVSESDVGVVQFNHALVLAACERLDEAANLLRKLLTRAGNGSAAPTAAECRKELAIVLARAGDFDQAVSEARRAVESACDTDDETCTRGCAAARESLGLVLSMCPDAEHRALAPAELLAALRVFETDATPQRRASLLSAYAAALLGCGRRGEAAEPASVAAQLRDSMTDLAPWQRSLPRLIVSLASGSCTEDAERHAASVLADPSAPAHRKRWVRDVMSRFGRGG